MIESARAVRPRFLTATAVALLACAGGIGAQTPPAGEAKPAAPARTPAEVKNEGSYSLGLSVGNQLRELGLTADALALERVTQGLRDALAGKAQPSAVDAQRIATLIDGVRTQLAERNRATAKEFLAKNAKRKDVVTTSSGLQYRIVEPGNGAPPKPGDQVTVHYRGTLLDGTEFDSSVKRGQPATFPVSGVIPGWQEALQLMRPGAKYELYIPPALAYDADSPPPIPPGSLLQFEVELLAVDPAGAQKDAQKQEQAKPRS